MFRRRTMSRAVAATSLAGIALLLGANCLAGADDHQSGITHGFLATGAETYIRDGQGKITWQYPHSTRDGWLLPNGNILLVLSKSKTYPGGGVVELGKGGKIVFEYKGTQAEVNTVQAIDRRTDPDFRGRGQAPPSRSRPERPDCHRGPLEGTDQGSPSSNPHGPKTGQRQLSRAATAGQGRPRIHAGGEVDWEVKTPNMPFTAIRLDNGNTLIGCTLGNLVIEVDAGARRSGN